MCLAVPCRIVTVDTIDGVRIATASVGDVVRRIDLTFVPEAGPGDYVIAHSGFAVALVSEQEATATLAVLHRSRPV